MNIFLNFKSKSCQHAYDIHDLQRGVSSFRNKLIAMFSLNLVVIIHLLLDPNIGSEAKETQLLPPCYSCIVLAVMMIISIYARQRKRNLTILLNLCPWLTPFAPSLYLLLQNPSIYEIFPQIGEIIQSSVSNTIYLTQFIVLGVLFLTNIVNQIIFTITGFAMIYYFLVSKVLIIGLPFTTITAGVLMLGILLYLRDKQNREAFLSMQNALDESFRWRSIIDHISEGVVGLDDKLEIAYSNEIANAFRVNAIATGKNQSKNLLSRFAQLSYDENILTTTTSYLDKHQIKVIL